MPPPGRRGPAAARGATGAPAPDRARPRRRPRALRGCRGGLPGFRAGRPPSSETQVRDYATFGAPEAPTPTLPRKRGRELLNPPSLAGEGGARREAVGGGGLKVSRVKLLPATCRQSGGAGCFFRRDNAGRRRAG